VVVSLGEEKRLKLEYDVEVPKKEVVRASEYERILREFLESRSSTARVRWEQKEGKPKAISVVSALRHTKDKLLLEAKKPGMEALQIELAALKVRSAKGEVFLQKGKPEKVKGRKKK